MEWNRASGRQKEGVSAARMDDNTFISGRFLSCAYTSFPFLGREACGFRFESIMRRNLFMDWTQLLKNEVESTYETTVKLLNKVHPESLDWKPASGSNWMTVGQLLKHISNACGAGCRAFVTGDWGLPPGMKIEDIPPEEMLPPAEKLPAIDSVENARQALLEDKSLALEMIDLAGEETLTDKKLAAPWAPGREFALGWHLLQMVRHLDAHKAQLFYYLKLQGESVNTADLWG
jgi:hypothetical protein